MRQRYLALLFVAILLPVPLPADGIQTGFIDRSVVVDGEMHRYQVYVPREYGGARPWPVILSLHGSGERGTDGLIQTEVGLGSAIRRDRDRYPAIVVFPQVPAGLTWQGGPGVVAMAALDATLIEYRTDRSRIYLTGLSMGGRGAWHLAWEHPQRFAALAVICAPMATYRGSPPIAAASGGDDYRALASRLAGIPAWIFHGSADSVVPVEHSRRMAAALEAAGGDVRYTEFDGVDHNSWDPAYRLEDFPAWLFAQRRR